MLAETTNLRRAQRVYGYLSTARQKEKMAVYYGQRGLGKSTALESIAIEQNAVYLYCLPGYSERSFIEDIVDACGLVPEGNSKAVLLKQVIKYFQESKRALLLDDCDNIAKGQLPEVARAIHDRAETIVILAGMERFAHKLMRWPQLVDRAHLLEFKPINSQDLKILAESLTQVVIKPCLLERILKVSEGKARLATRAINYVDQYGRANNVDIIDSKSWGDQPLLPNPETSKAS
jgi:DNA transposition AAA+ family ATPase